MRRQNTYDADERPLGGRLAEVRPSQSQKSSPITGNYSGKMELRLGDAVAAMAKAAGLKETTGCGCARRRAVLNRWTPAWLSQLLGRLGRARKQPKT
jgi:hypothetical protein